MSLSTKEIFQTKQRLSTLRLKANQLTQYIDSLEELEEEVIDDPYLTELVFDIQQLHKKLTP